MQQHFAPLRISIVIRSLGRRSLVRALQSVAAQTIEEADVVVVDALGAGHPALPAHCGRYPLRLVTRRQALNRPQAANVGLDEANGDYLVFLDDDDAYAPNHLASLVTTLLDHPDCRAAYSWTRLLDTDGRVMRELRFPFDRLRLLRANYIQTACMLFDAELVRKAGCRFDEMLLQLQDWDFWLQLAEHTPFACTRAATVNWYAASGESGSGLGGNFHDPGFAHYQRLVEAKWAAPREALMRSLREAVDNATALQNADAHDEAWKLLADAMRLAPSDPGLLNYAAINAGLRGDHALAVRLLVTALDYQPGDAALQRNLQRMRERLTPRAMRTQAIASH